MNGLETWLMILFTATIAVFTFLVWKVYERIAWLTGAMESHSEWMLRIEACRGIRNEPIKLIWWDPTIAEPPSQKQKQHGKEIDMSIMYIFLPLNLRRHKRSRIDKLKRLFSLPD
jgi:hypothetical protein